MAFRRKNHLQKNTCDMFLGGKGRLETTAKHSKTRRMWNDFKLASPEANMFAREHGPFKIPKKKTIPFPSIKFSRCEKDDVSFLGADFPMFKKNKHLRVPGRCCCNYTFKASIAGTALLHICTWKKSSWETCGYWILLMVPNHPGRKPPFGCTKACKYIWYLPTGAQFFFHQPQY